MAAALLLSILPPTQKWEFAGRLQNCLSATILSCAGQIEGCCCCFCRRKTLSWCLFLLRRRRRRWQTKLTRDISSVQCQRRGETACCQRKLLGEMIFLLFSICCGSAAGKREGKGWKPMTSCFCPEAQFRAQRAFLSGVDISPLFISFSRRPPNPFELVKQFNFHLPSLKRGALLLSISRISSGEDDFFSLRLRWNVLHFVKRLYAKTRPHQNFFIMVAGK